MKKKRKQYRKEREKKRGGGNREMFCLYLAGILSARHLPHPRHLRRRRRRTFPGKEKRKEGGKNHLPLQSIALWQSFFPLLLFVLRNT